LIYLNGTNFSSASEAEDSAGRRIALSFSGFDYAFTWRADNLLESALSSRAHGSGIYTYDLAGQILTRVVGVRTTSITQRDGTGRPLAITTTLFGVTKMTETLGWRPDSKLTAHTIARYADFTNQQVYGYVPWSGGLGSERINLD